MLNLVILGLAILVPAILGQDILGSHPEPTQTGFATLGLTVGGV
jgi:hypothetical protein